MKKILTIVVLLVVLSAATSSLAVAATGEQQGPVIHYVAPGETLYGIAARYRVPVGAIMQANGLRNPDLIYAGQPLRIPVGEGIYPPGMAPVPGGCTYHTVRAGDTLSAIAMLYGVSVRELMVSNRIYNPDMVYVGQRICVPGRPGYAPPSVPAYYHTVVPGDTLSSISLRYGVSPQAILNANDIANPNFIWVGQRLLIPGYRPGPVPEPYPHPAPYRPAPQAQPAPPPEPIPYVDDEEDTPPPPQPQSQGTIPDAPDYQPVPAKAPLPLADQPIEVVVNGGASWVGKDYPSFDDPNGITTLIVSTADKTRKPTVRIRSGDYEVKGELDLVPEFGVDKLRFAFKYIPPGDYDVWVDDPEVPSDTVQVKVEAGKRVEVEFRKGLAFSGPTYASPDGWYLAGWDNPSVPGKNLGAWSNITVKTPASGLWVMIRSEGNGYQAKCFTGSKAPGICDFAGLSAGIYFIWIDGTDLTLKTYMDGNAFATFEFARQPVPGEEPAVGPVSYD